MKKLMKNTLRKVLNLVAAVAMVVSVSGISAIPAFAATSATGSNGATTGTATAASGQGGNATITINLPTAYTGGGTAQNYNYKVYKVFDATYSTSNSGSNPTSYTAFRTVSGNTGIPNIGGNGNKFVMDDAGNVYYGTLHDNTTNGAIEIKVGGQTKYLVVKTGELEASEAQTVGAAIRTYLNLDTGSTGTAATPVADVEVANTFSSLEITGLTYGYYYITTTAGTAIALTSTNPNATISSKNDIPSIEKIITKVDDNGGNSASTKGSITDNGKQAIAELGSTVHFQTTIHVKKGATGYVFRDHMDSTLSFNTNSVTVQTKIGDANAQTVQASTTSGGSTTTNYTLTTTAGSETVAGTANTAYTFKIAFEDTFISNLLSTASSTDDVKIIISYTANVTSDALQSNPAKNSATIAYGDHVSDASTTETYNAKFSVKKLIEGTTTPLQGASFVIAKGAGTEESPYSYYKYTPSSTSEGTTTPATVTWTSNLSDATVLSSDATGVVKYTSTSPSYSLDAFTGLTDGSYTLIETVAPDGYNKAENTTFTINGATAENALTASNLEQSTTVYDRAGTSLPSTGGIGTTIFYVIGGVLIAGAAILLISRRRRAE